MNAQIGLCAACRYARTIDNRRGSRFWLCILSRTDSRFPRYPNLPVLSCRGHEPGRPEPHREAGESAADNGAA